MTASLPDPVNLFLTALARHGCEPRPAGNGQWSARCPSHEDAAPSLSVGVGEGGRVLITCHVGCTFSDIVAAVGLRLRDLNPAPRGDRASPRFLCETPYPIRDAAGTVQAVHVRRDYADGSKGFAWRQPDGRSGLAKRPTASLPLYGSERLGDVPHGSTVLLVEGEKARDALERAGFMAFATVTGAKGTPDADVLRVLLSFDVVCWPDADAVGLAHMARCAALLLGLGAKPRLLTWTGAGTGDDAADFFERGGTPAQLDAMTAAATFHDGKLPSRGADGSGVDMVCLINVEPREARYLWRTYLPLGKVTLLDGDPGCGKTYLATVIAAVLTVGGRFPGEDAAVTREPAGVVYVGAEDDPAETLRPRFESQGADLARVHVFRGRRDGAGNVVPVDLSDLSDYADAVRATGACLLVLDPIQAFMPPGRSMNDAGDVRPLLAALARLAEDLEIAVLIIRHFRKSGAGRALYAGMGSIDFAAAARSVLLVGEDPERDGVRVLAHAKCSSGPLSDSLAFEIREGRFLWAGTSELRAADLCRDPQPGETGAGDNAADFLRAELADGSVPAPELKARAQAAGIAWRTVERAKRRLGVRSCRQGGLGGTGSWAWELPGEGPKEGGANV